LSGSTSKGKEGKERGERKVGRGEGKGGERYRKVIPSPR